MLPITHSGNWDVAGLWVTRRWGSMTTVAERLKPESLYEKFVAYRESLGMEILPLTGGCDPVHGAARSDCSAGGIVPLVGDRDLSASGVPVTFFGETATMPPGPAMLAALTDSYLCPTNLSFTDSGLGDPHPPADDAARHPARPSRSAAAPRTSPGSSSGASASTRPTGTCCSRCGGGPGRPAPGAGDPVPIGQGRSGMRVGLVCPYSFDIPGGVQAHVADLARTLIGLGHHVSVLAPGDDSDGIVEFPEFVVASGRSIPIPYNGSVARLSFGPVSYTKVRKWIRAGKFDVLHVHEPVAPSLSFIALMVADGPIVATFHTANPRSRWLNALSGACCSRSWRRSPAGSRSANWPGRCRSSTSAATR